MLRIASVFSILTICFLTIGCGSGSTGPATYPVTGTVTFDGQPVKSGDILFEPESGEGAEGGQIADGKYSLKAKAGNTKVRITASRDIPGKTVKGAMGEDISEKEQYIPAPYNTETIITKTIASGSNTFDFKLTKDGAAPAN